MQAYDKKRKKKYARNERLQLNFALRALGVKEDETTELFGAYRAASRDWRNHFIDEQCESNPALAKQIKEGQGERKWRKCEKYNITPPEIQKYENFFDTLQIPKGNTIFVWVEVLDDAWVDESTRNTWRLFTPHKIEIDGQQKSRPGRISVLAKQDALSRKITANSYTSQVLALRALGIEPEKINELLYHIKQFSVKDIKLNQRNNVYAKLGLEMPTFKNIVARSFKLYPRTQKTIKLPFTHLQALINDHPTGIIYLEYYQATLNDKRRWFLIHQQEYAAYFEATKATTAADSAKPDPINTNSNHNA